MRLGFKGRGVLPLPEPPMTKTFLFRAVLGSLGAAVHGQPFRLRQQDVIFENGVDKRLDVLARSPARRAILTSFAELLRVLAFLRIHGKPEQQPGKQTDEQIGRMETWQRRSKAEAKPSPRCSSFGRFVPPPCATPAPAWWRISRSRSMADSAPAFFAASESVKVCFLRLLIGSAPCFGFSRWSLLPVPSLFPAVGERKDVRTAFGLCTGQLP